MLTLLHLLFTQKLHRYIQIILDYNACQIAIYICYPAMLALYS